MMQEPSKQSQGWVWLGLQLLVLIVTGLVGVLLVATSQPEPVSITLVPPATATPLSTVEPSSGSLDSLEDDTPQTAAVYVVGAVVAPGVVYVPENSLIDAAIREAGGFRADADPVAVNLAQRVRDGMQITVPIAQADPGFSARGTPQPVVRDVPTQPTMNARSASTVTGLLRINQATLEELQTLPGVGPVTAQNILDFRQTVGNIVSDADLLRVNGIGEARFQQIRPLITYD